MTIYVVKRGIYSDQEICGVFDNRELAELATKAYGDARNSSTEEGYIEEFELNEHREAIESGFWGWTVWFDSEGLLIKAERTGELGTEENFDEGVIKGQPNDFYRKYNYWVHVRAHDEEHARKVASDRRAMLIASYQGVT